MSLLRKPTDHHCRCAMIAGFPESVQGVYLIQVGRMPTFSLKSEARGLALELVFCATGWRSPARRIPTGSSTPNQKKSRRRKPDHLRMARSSPRLGQRCFFGDNIGCNALQTNSHHLFFSNSIQSTIKVGEVWFSPKLLTKNR